MRNFENILPNSWLITYLGNILELKYGKGLTKETRDETGFPVYGSNGIVGKHSKPLVLSPCLIIGRKGSIGEVHLSKIACSPIDTTYYVDQFYEQPLEYWYYQLKYLRLNELDRASAIPGLNKEDAYKQQIPLPPLPEQRRIVAKIDALFERSRRARQFLEAIPPLLEKFRQSVLAAAFRGDLTKEWREKNKTVEPASVLLERIRAERRKRWEETELAKMQAKGREPLNDDWKAKYVEPEPVDTSDLPELPEGWEWASWETVGKCQNGRAFPSKFYQTDGVKLLRPGNLHFSGQLVWNDQNTTYMPESWGQDYPDFLVEANQLIINLTAQSLKDEFLGRVCLSGENEYCLLNQRLARLTPVEQLPVGFFLWLFKSPIFRQFVDGLNTGTLIQHMFTSQINKFYVPLPPLKEIEQIILEVEKRLETITAIKQYIESSTKQIEILNQSILAKAFRGELVPQDPNDEPASVLLERIKAERATNEEAKNGKKVKPKLAAKQKEQLQQSDVINQAQPSTANTPAKKDDEEEWEMVQLSLFDS